MKPDPPIDDIREIRHQISASVGHDPRKLVEHYRQLQERHGDRIVSRNVAESKPKDENAAQALTTTVVISPFITRDLSLSRD